MTDPIRIVGFAGSLRRHSYNGAALRAAAELLPADAALEIIALAEMPFFDEDVEAAGLPAPVAAFRDRLAAAEAFLIATPEYNYSLPAVLKNALDWASRGEAPPMAGKPLGIMSASTGMLGGARVQYHLRQTCVALDLRPLNDPQVFIARAHKHFDDQGRLVSEFFRGQISRLLAKLVNEARRNR